MCIYRDVRKSGAFHIPIKKNWVSHILFVEKRGPIIYLAALKKGAIRHAHPYYDIYRKLPPTPQPPLPRVWIILNSKKDYRLLRKGPVQIGKLPSFFHFVVLTKTSIGSAYVTINKVFISANLIVSSLLRTLPGSSYLLNFVYRLSERLSK